MTSTVSSPSTAVNVAFGGGSTWSNPSNVLASDNVYATASIGPAGSGDSTALVSASGFNFSSIPSDHVVSSIKVEVEAQRLGGGTVYCFARLTDGSGTSDFYQIGSTSISSVDLYFTDIAPDNWGSSSWLDLARVKGAGFTVQVYMINLSGGTQSLSFDHVRVTIESKPPPTNVSASLPSISVTSLAASAIGAASVAVALPSIGVTAPAGTANALTSAPASLPSVSISPPEASVVTSANVSAALPAVSITAPAAIGAQGASATLPGISVSPPEATATIRLITPPSRTIVMTGSSVTDRTITFPQNLVSDRTITMN